MIKEFINGKKYRYTGEKRPIYDKTHDSNWNIEGEMDFVLDGKPRIAVNAYNKDACFKETDSEYRDSPWNWKYGFENWVEVTTDIIATEGEY